MNDDAFATLLELLMVSDPWPLDRAKEHLEDFADDQALARGFSDWIEAYHAQPLARKV
jgi:hypothetical protein